MTEREDHWLPLVDGPIARIVSTIEAEDPEIQALAESPETRLAFRTFANIRVGIVLGRLLMESEVEAYDGSETWVEQLLQDPQHRNEIAAEVRAVADELAEAESGDTLAPDEATRNRFRELVRRELSE